MCSFMMYNILYIIIWILAFYMFVGVGVWGWGVNMTGIYYVNYLATLCFYVNIILWLLQPYKFSVTDIGGH